MKNKTLVISLSAIAVIAVIIFIVIYSKKKSSATSGAGSFGAGSGSGAGVPAPPPCVPYTQEQYKRDLQGLRGKCNPKLLIPIVGIGAFNKCMQQGKSALPPIKNCY